MNVNLLPFTADCQRRQARDDRKLQRYFTRLINRYRHRHRLRGDGKLHEGLLQAYLYLNLDRLFPGCSTLLLHEEAVHGELSGMGYFSCDFAFLTRGNHVLLVETKFIDTENSGKLAKKARTTLRKNVLYQVTARKKLLQLIWHVPPGLVDCAVFTTDPWLETRLTLPDSRFHGAGVIARHVTIGDLQDWLDSRAGTIPASLPGEPRQENLVAVERGETP